MKIYKIVLFVTVTVTLLTAQFGNVQPVYADDEPPIAPSDAVPTEAPVESELPPVSESPVVAPVENMVAPMDMVPTEEPVEETVAAAESLPIEETPLLEAIQELPEQIDIVVLDENGEVLPLATQDAAEIITQGDPIWCPTGVVPVANATGDPNNTCTNTFTSLSELVARFVPTADGTIWIQNVADAGSSVVINGGAGGTWHSASSYNLTLQGGWTLAPALDAISGTSTFTNHSITISNWTGNVTINNITVNGVTGTGLTVTTTGDIDVANSHFDNNGGGMNVLLSGAVDVIDSSFDSNGGAGLLVVDATDINISGSSFSGNQRYSGLDIKKAATVSILNSTLNHNRTWDGASIDTLTGNPTIANSLNIENSHFEYNNQRGIYAGNIQGNIILNNVFANSNRGGMTIHSSGAVDVIDSSFDSNWGAGLLVEDATDISVSGSSFSNNQRYSGLDIKKAATVSILDSTLNGNRVWDGVTIITLTGNPTIANTLNIENSHFEYNNQRGIYGGNIQGNITLNNVTTSHNGYGLMILSNGDITINSITNERNSQNGAILDNTQGVGNVTVNGALLRVNAQNGFTILSNGNIALHNIIGEGNLQNGILLFTPGEAVIDQSTFQGNHQLGVDASAVCTTLALDNVSGEVGYPLTGDYTYTYTYSNPEFEEPITITRSVRCEPKVYVNGVLVNGKVIESPSSIYHVTGDEVEIPLDCSERSQYNVDLTNDDRVQVNCPVTGKAIIKRLDSTMLPGDIPAGYSYASAFSLEILQSGNGIKSIEDGGNVVVSFNVPSTQAGTMYSILYWDADKQMWIPLKDFLLDENGMPRVFNLYPNDPRLILSGLNFVQEGNSLRAELTTNFPGIFVLVQR